MSPDTSKSEKRLVEILSEKYRKFCIWMASISGAAIAVMMLSTTLDSTSRYLLNRPIKGVFELNEIVLVICVFMGVAWTQIERGHIRVTALLEILSARGTCILNLIAWTVSFIFVFILGYQTAVGAWESYLIREFRWGSVQMPIWWVKCLIPIGCWMLNIQLLLDMWKEIEHLSGRLPVPGTSRSKTT